MANLQDLTQKVERVAKFLQSNAPQEVKERIAAQFIEGYNSIGNKEAIDPAFNSTMEIAASIISGQNRSL